MLTAPTREPGTDFESALTCDPSTVEVIAALSPTISQNRLLASANQF